MTVMTKSGIAAAVLGAFWLGVMVAPHMPAMPVDAPQAQVEAATPEATTAACTPARPVARETKSTLAATAEPVQEHVKPLLTWGTDPQKAADGFTNAEDFVATAYAAKNTEVPFMLLKHRVLNEKQKLASAIRASRPELDATLETDRATLEARANLARLQTM